MLKTREEYVLDHLPDNIIGAELGVFEGDFSQILFDSGKFEKLFLVDIFHGLMFSGDKNGRNGKTIDLNNAYDKLIHRYHNDQSVEIIKNTTEVFLNSLFDNSLSFVYIDADHSYDAVVRDLRLSRFKVCDGGIIAGHDYNINQFPGVYAAVNEFVTEHRLLVTFTTDDELASYFISNTKKC
jgi:hypothetical protein